MFKTRLRSSGQCDLSPPSHQQAHLLSQDRGTRLIVERIAQSDDAAIGFTSGHSGLDAFGFVVKLEPGASRIGEADGILAEHGEHGNGGGLIKEETRTDGKKMK